MNADFYISPRAITITPNAENNNPDYVGISVVGGTAIRVRNVINVPDGNGGSTRIEIGYAPDLSYRKWTLIGGNTYVGNDHSYALNIYARLDASEDGDKGLVMLSKDDKPLETTTETGHYYFLKIGELSAPQQNGLRELTLWDTGELDTNQGINNEKNGDFDKAFTLGSQHITPKLPFYGLKLFANSGITFLTNGFFKFGENGTAINELITTVSVAAADFSNWAKANAIATTQSIVSYCRSFFIRKDADDVTTHKLTMSSMACTGNNLPSGAFAADITGDAKITGTTQMHGGFIAGDQTSQTQNYVENVRGSKLYWNGSGWQFDCDFLHVSKKAFFKELEIDKVSHIGGQQILTACGCVVEHVRRNSVSGEYYIFFAKEDKDGNPVTNDWRKGDLAYCQTFNVAQGVSQGVSNRYYWAKVVYVGDAVSTSMVDSITGETFDPSKYHRIVIKCTNTSGQAPNCDIPSLNADGTPCVDTNKNVSDTPTIGDNVVLLGHVKQSNETDEEARERQGATLLAGAGQWQQALVMWTGIGADANNPFVMPEPQVVISPRGVKIVADEIALKSSGQLLLTSNQLKCTNAEGQQTLGLDQYGNGFFSGTINQARINAVGIKYNTFFTILNSDDYTEDGDSGYPYTGTGKFFAYVNDGSIYDAVCRLTGNHERPNSGDLLLLPDMFRLSGMVTLGDMTGAQNLNDEEQYGFIVTFPFCIPTQLDFENAINPLNPIVHFDTCRTPVHVGNDFHLISWEELNTIVGRKITFYNNTSHTMYVQFPNLQKVEANGKEYYIFTTDEYDTSSRQWIKGWHYTAEEVGSGRSIIVEIVSADVRVFDNYGKNANDTEIGYRTGIFPLVYANNWASSPLGGTIQSDEWGSENVEIE